MSRLKPNLSALLAVAAMMPIAGRVAMVSEGAKPKPENRGRRAEKDAAAIAKAEAKRARKQAKRLARKDHP